MNGRPCHHPTKSRFATVEAAEIAAARAQVPLGVRLRAYDDCPCGWVHLTSRDAPTLTTPVSKEIA